LTKLPLGTTNNSRSVAEVPDINVYNRYFEQDPTNLEDQVALLCRPSLRKWLTVGSGPIRAVYSCPGAFSDAVFVVSGTTLYRIDTDETVTSIGTVDGTGFVSMAATYQYLFIANGASLQYYDGSLHTIAVPDGDGVISVAVIGGYCICVIAVTSNSIKNGRFYWIQPGAVIINALDFATAERSPDTVWSCMVFGDQLWLLGPSTTEVWYLSGNGNAPFVRQQGRLFDKGIWRGTAIQIKDTVMAIGNDGTVYKIGASPEIVSTPGIAQVIREAINLQREG
jgi:hypothetical protein